MSKTNRTTTRGDLDPDARCVGLLFLERSLTSPYIRWACPLHPTGDWVFGRWTYTERPGAVSHMMQGLRDHMVQIHPDLRHEKEEPT